VLNQEIAPIVTAELTALDALLCVKWRFGRVDFTLPSLDDVEDFAGNVAFETTDGFEFGVPFSEASGNVLLGTGIGSQAADRNNVERAVRSSIATAV
jgi:hypothetical protein